MTPTVGERISAIIVPIEQALWHHEAANATPPKFTDDGFRAATKIFMAACLDRMWNLQSSEKMTIEDRMAMAQSMGEEIHKIVKVYLDIDTHTLYA